MKSSSPELSAPLKKLWIMSAIGPDLRQSASSQSSAVQVECSTVLVKRLLCAATFSLPLAVRSTIAAAIGRASSKPLSSADTRCGTLIILSARRCACALGKRVAACCITSALTKRC